jgi:hypothetical protein
MDKHRKKFTWEGELSCWRGHAIGLTCLARVLSNTHQPTTHRPHSPTNRRGGRQRD